MADTVHLFRTKEEGSYFKILAATVHGIGITGMEGFIGQIIYHSHTGGFFFFLRNETFQLQHVSITFKDSMMVKYEFFVYSW